MKEFTRPEAVILSYPLRSRGDPDDFLFLDIETTGLTPETAQIYLIGALSHTEDTGWTLRQWFADSLSSEEEILRAFFSFASANARAIFFSVSPSHIDLISLAFLETTGISNISAKYLAYADLPVPGAPYRHKEKFFISFSLILKACRVL